MKDHMLLMLELALAKEYLTPASAVCSIGYPSAVPAGFENLVAKKIIRDPEGK